MSCWGEALVANEPLSLLIAISITTPNNDGTLVGEWGWGGRSNGAAFYASQGFAEIFA
jgi:hypothetical protein